MYIHVCICVYMMCIWPRRANLRLVDCGGHTTLVSLDPVTSHVRSWLDKGNSAYVYKQTEIKTHSLSATFLWLHLCSICTSQARGGGVAGYYIYGGIVGRYWLGLLLWSSVISSSNMGNRVSLNYLSYYAQVYAATMCYGFGWTLYVPWVQVVIACMHAYRWALWLCGGGVVGIVCVEVGQ